MTRRGLRALSRTRAELGRTGRHRRRAKTSRFGTHCRFMTGTRRMDSRPGALFLSGSLIGEPHLSCFRGQSLRSAAIHRHLGLGRQFMSVARKVVLSRKDALLVRHRPLDPGQGEDTLLHVEAEPFEEILDPDDGFFGLMSVKGTTTGPDIQSIVGVPEGSGTALPVFEFRQASPNPFALGTTLTYVLRRAGRVKIEVFDIQGRLIRTIRDDWNLVGQHSAGWGGTDQAGRPAGSGVYFFRVSVDGAAVGSQAVVLLR